MAGGTVEAHGDGSTGVEASVGGYSQTGGTGDALAENSGSVTTSGDVYELVDPNNANHGAIRSPAGVRPLRKDQERRAPSTMKAA